MSKKMLINTMDEEESRMAIVEDGVLTEFNIKMSVREPTTGNIYRGIVQKVERGLRAAFVEYGSRKNGFLPLRDVSQEYLDEKDGKLPVGKEILVQVLREEKGHKGAMLTTYISLPGRYLVLMPNRNKSGVSRKIDDEHDRKRLMEIMEQVSAKENLHFIVRTAGMSRTKQELSRDYQMLLRLWKDLKAKSEKEKAPALIYQESDFAVRSLRDFYTSDIDEILVDDSETYSKMRAYCKSISPRTVRNIKLYKEETPIFDKFRIEKAIDAIYQERVGLRSGGYLIIEPTEALTTIDVNSGRASSRKDVEETAFRTNIEAAEEIARQLRLRDSGGLIVIDFIDMMDRKHISEVEKTFRNALNLDRARIQLSKISRFGLLELSRQKKQSTIQEVSYTSCPHCKGRGVRPSVEYLALNVYRKIKTEAVKGIAGAIKVTLPVEVSDYLLNQKRTEISKLEDQHDISIHISGDTTMFWGEFTFEIAKKEDIDQDPSREEETLFEKAEVINHSERKEYQRNRRRPRRRKPRTEQRKGDESSVNESDGVDKGASSANGNGQEKKGIVGKLFGIFK